MAKDPGERGVAPKKEDLLKQKETELASIVDQHDDLVRERYHLERFVTMIVGFDPAIVKHEKGQDFERYARGYDLYLKHGHLLGAGRASRRRAPVPGPSTPATKHKGHVNEVEKIDGRQRIIPAKRKHDKNSVVNLSAEVLPMDSEEIKVGRSSKTSVILQETDVVPNSSPPSKLVGISKSKGKGRQSVNEQTVSDVDITKANKAKHKAIMKMPAGQGSKRKVNTDSNPAEPKSKRLRALAQPRPPSPPRLPAPPPRYTCPEQAILPDQVYDGTAKGFMASYTMLEEKEVDAAYIHNQAFATAKIRERVRTLQQYGIVFGDSYDENEEPSEDSLEDRNGGQIQKPLGRFTISTVKAAPEPKRTVDHRDHMLIHAQQVRNAMLAEWKIHIASTKRIARAVQVYWDLQLNKDERDAREEERKRKLLVRDLIKSVKAKWQLAVNVVRARRAAEAKAEQDRLGKEHLDSILERSRDLLGKQSNNAMDDVIDDETDRSDITMIEDDNNENAGENPDEDTDVDIGDVADGTGDENEEEEEEEKEEEEEGDWEEGEKEEKEENEDESELLEGQVDLEDPVEAQLEAEGDENLGDLMLSDNHDLAAKSPDDSRQANDISTLGHSRNLLDEKDISEQEQTKDQVEPLLLHSVEAKVSISDRRAKAAAVRKSLIAKITTDDPDADDVDFADREDMTDEDHMLEAEMEEEEEANDSDDEDEDEGLLADADLPIEDLLKRYGYGVPAPEAARNSEESASHAASEDSASDAESDEDASSEAETASISESDEQHHGFRKPFLIRADLRPYQQAGLEWLAQLYRDKRNAILADEMGLGKTLQTIALLAHLACDHGQWGPHLIVVPTSVILNWEMEFKKFLPGFKILTYYGNQQERKDLRKGWMTPHAFEVVITSYQIVLADEFIFKRRQWKYLILDEAHNIKNFRSQRWQTLLGFKSERRLLLTGTPLQNNLMELWSLLYFLMPHGLSSDTSETGGFANHKEFNEWFSNPMEKAVELGGALSEEAKATVNRLHVILRPYILRRLKSEVETQLPGKFEHVIYCSLSKRQRYLYDEFMSRASTRESLVSGGYLGVANCLMQLRKVCNHPDLFEVRPIRTSFVQERSIAGDAEPKYSRIQRLLPTVLHHYRAGPRCALFPDLISGEDSNALAGIRTRQLDASALLPSLQLSDAQPRMDVRTPAGWEAYRQYSELAASASRWDQIRYLNKLRCNSAPVFGHSLRMQIRTMFGPPQLTATLTGRNDRLVHTTQSRLQKMRPYLDRFANATPAVVAKDMPSFVLPSSVGALSGIRKIEFDSLHPAAVKLQIAFPDRSLLQHDCGKLQLLSQLLKDLKTGGHRVLIFTQMTRMLDILEIFLSHNGHRYSRLDGSTKVEDRLLVTERFNASPKIFALIASTRSGGVGINLTGADTVIFYDNEFNPAMDKQAMDRAHRIGQTREVHIYRLVTAHTVEENMLKKANQKRRLDDLIMQEGDFTTDYFAKTDLREMLGEDVISGLDIRERASVSATPAPSDAAVEEKRVQEALAAAEDEEDAAAAKQAYQDIELDAPDFGPDEGPSGETNDADREDRSATPGVIPADEGDGDDDEGESDEEDEDEAGAIDEYMLSYVDYEWHDYFSSWKGKRLR